MCGLAGVSFLCSCPGTIPSAVIPVVAWCRRSRDTSHQSPTGGCCLLPPLPRFARRCYPGTSRPTVLREYHGQRLEHIFVIWNW
ncbi:unnamed protein product [Effrenium voratum]|uniref:Uncharacterized protein n=1 Tax=Effrenium voratum TaxID=2562239 RepID=A0AA36JJX3_9DINO|nr:unnamed protein product [Effrenium voratum]